MMNIEQIITEGTNEDDEPPSISSDETINSPNLDEDENEQELKEESQLEKEIEEQDFSNKETKEVSYYDEINEYEDTNDLYEVNIAQLGHQLENKYIKTVQEELVERFGDDGVEFYMPVKKDVVEELKSKKKQEF